MNKNVLALAVCSLLTACGGSGGGSGGAGGGVGPKDFTLSGSVSGLTGTLDLINTNNQETVSIAGNSFAFSQKLADQEQYDINLASAADGQQLCEVIDGTGVVAAASVTDIEIVCRDWVDGATTLDAGVATARYPKIASVADEIHVTWYDESIGSWIFKRSYDDANGWAAAAPYAEAAGYAQNSHEFVANNQGQSMFTYKTSVPYYTYEFIFASDTLDVTQTNFSSQGERDEYAIDIDEQGHVLLVWVAPDDLVLTEKSLYYRYFDGSWGSKGKLETNTTGDVRNPVVKFTGNGIAVAAWEFATHPGPVGSAIYDAIKVASFDASKAADKWTADSSVDTANGGCGQVVTKSIDIDVTEDGTPAVAWMQGNGQCDSNDFKQPLLISKLEESTWSAPINISGIDSSSSHAKILALAGNKILAAYNDNDKTYAKTCDLTTDVCTSATDLAAQFREIQSLAKDKNNNVMAAWLGLDAASNPQDLYVNRYDAVNDSWSAMSKINNDTVGQADIAVLDNDFVLTWSENVDLSSSIVSTKAVSTTRWSVFAKEFVTQ